MLFNLKRCDGGGSSMVDPPLPVGQRPSRGSCWGSCKLLHLWPCPRGMFVCYYSVRPCKHRGDNIGAEMSQFPKGHPFENTQKCLIHQQIVLCCCHISSFSLLNDAHRPLGRLFTPPPHPPFQSCLLNHHVAMMWITNAHCRCPGSYFRPFSQPAGALG